jgi:6-phosphogluconolactonase (cycloisomerase 2 family)
MMLKPNESFVYIFSWNLKSGNPGLGLYKFNDDTGEIGFIKMLNEDLSYGYAIPDARRGILYCCVDTDKHPDLRAGGGGALYAYKLDPETGYATEMNHVSTYCPNPSYVSVSPDGNYLAASMHSTMDNVTKVKKDAFGTPHIHVEFSDSGVILFKLNDDGSIGELLDINIHSGCGPKPRQLQPHAHCAVMAPRGDLFAVCDKGNDGIYMYRIDRETNTLILNNGAPYRSRPGTAPRYCAFHPTRPFFFKNNEMEPEIDSFMYDSSGNLKYLSSVRAVPEEYALAGGDRCVQQDFQIDPSGRYIYAMLQGRYNGISVFETDQKTAGLKFIQHVPVKGIWARDFSFSADCKYLVTACLSSGDIACYAIGDDGKLRPTGYESNQSAANCVVFYKPN